MAEGSRTPKGRGASGGNPKTPRGTRTTQDQRAGAAQDRRAGGAQDRRATDRGTRRSGPGQAADGRRNRSTGGTDTDGGSRGRTRTNSGFRPGRPAAGDDSRRGARSGSGPRWAADGDGARSRGAAGSRDGGSGPGGRTRRPSGPGATRSAGGGHRGAGSSGTRPYATRRDDADPSAPRTRGQRPGAGSPPDRPVREGGDATWRTPRDRAAGPPRHGGRDRPAWSARSRDGERTRDRERIRDGDRTRSGEHSRSGGRERPGGGRPRSGDRTGRGERTWAGRDEAPARPPRETGPQLPDSVTPQELDPEARSQLNSLPNDLADTVARYLVAAGLADDPEQGYAYARAAKRLAARVGVVREACGIAAYRTGRWAEALSELRAARRMTGRDDYLPIMADSERALGRLDRALALVREASTADLDRATQIELRIVESGIRRDQGLPDAAILALQVPELTSGRLRPWSARLFYAYADALLAAGRADEARDAFVRAAEADPDGETDAADRLDELDGIEFDDLEEDELDGGPDDGEVEAGEVKRRG